MQRHRMPDGHVIAENERALVAHYVQYAPVLNIGARPDADVIHVAANDDKRPNAGVIANHYVADEHRSSINVSGSSDGGMSTLVGSNVSFSLQRCWFPSLTKRTLSRKLLQTHAL
jgi:hypothetical protein